MTRSQPLATRLKEKRLFITKSNISSESRVPTREESREQVFYVYILRTSSNTLYIGQTNNLEKKLLEHKSKNTKAAKYTRYFDSFTLVYTEEYQTRTESMQREWLLKQWSRAKKECLICGDKIGLKKA